MINAHALNEVAKTLLARGKGILAADESSATAGKRFEKLGILSVPETHAEYREMLFTTPGLNQYISGVIMYDETIRQHSSDNRSFVSVLQSQGILPGIKVDLGTEPMPGSPEEKITTGFDGLSERLAEYARLGAVFAKWRAVITIGKGLPTNENILANAKDLAMYARACQEAGIVPIVEPEILMDGNHTQKECYDAAYRTLKDVFNELRSAGVAIDGMILKTSMVTPGSGFGVHASPDEVADMTVKLFRETLPLELPGQAFLSGGETEIEATQNLQAIAKSGPFPWAITFSYGRALQDSALATWAGIKSRVPEAQEKLLKRAKMNSLASMGEYSGEE